MEIKRLFLIGAALALLLVPLESAAELLPPVVGVGWTNGWVREWCRDVPGLCVTDSTVQVSDRLTKVVRRWTWTGDKPLAEVTLCVRYHVAGDSVLLKPFIPGVLLYGNPSNKGRTDGRVPVFVGEAGEFAIFEEHRLPMPFALLENSKTGEYAALHVLPSPVRGARREDLWWSLGVEVVEGGTDIMMLSGPVGYNRRRSVVKALQGGAMSYDDAYVTLQPGQIVEKTFWIETGTTSAEAFGFERALDTSLDLFKPYFAERFTPFGDIVRAKRDFALTRWIEGPMPGACGFAKYDLNAQWRHIVIGWCGCAATCAYALPVLNFAPGDWEKAQCSLDFLCDAFGNKIAPTGGVFDATFDMNTGRTWPSDPVSCGQGLYSIMKAIRFAEKSGGRLDTTKWRTFALKAADAMAREILRDDWQEPGSNGPGFEIAPLVVASELFGRRDFLAAAEKMAAAFERRYFGYEHVYWGGTLDASCEDKEGAYAAFQGYEALLRNAVKAKDSKAERRYARLARHAMNSLPGWDSFHESQCLHPETGSACSCALMGVGGSQ